MKRPKVVAIIPARYASQRFPGKILVRDTGKYLIEHVYEQVASTSSISMTMVATDDARILEAVKGFGGEAVMTRSDHPNGTSRIAEAASKLDCDLIVNVQGDEPEIRPADIEGLISLMIRRSELPMGTLAARFASLKDVKSPSCVKVVVDRLGNAMYFSRSPVPYCRSSAVEIGDPSNYLLHVGVYAYRREFLLEYVRLEATPLEKSEGLEQLRALENGHSIGVNVIEEAAIGIDTPKEYAAFVRRRRNRGGAS